MTVDHTPIASPAGSSRRAALRTVRQSNLVRNSSALVASQGLNVIGGVLFTVVTTRYGTKDAVGVTAAIISAQSLIGSLANLGMTRTLARFLGTAPDPAQLVMSASALVLTATGVTSGIFILISRHVGLPGLGVLEALAFALLCLLSAVKGTLETYCVAMNRSHRVLQSGAIFNLTKIASIVVLAAVSPVRFGWQPVLACQVACVVGPCAWLVLRTRGYKRLFAVSPSLAVLRARGTFAVGSYVTDLIGGLPLTVLPLMVLAKLGTAASAEWYVVMQIIGFLLILMSSVNQASYAEMAANPGDLRAAVRRAWKLMTVVMVPPVLVVLVAAPLLLRVFAPAYASGAGLLRLLSLFALVGIGNYVAGSILAIRLRVGLILAANFANAAVVLTYGVLFARSLTGFGTAWVLGELINIVMFWSSALRVVTKPVENGEANG